MTPSVAVIPCVFIMVVSLRVTGMRRSGLTTKLGAKTRFTNLRLS